MHYESGGGACKVAAARRSVATGPAERIERMAAAHAVVIFSNSTCCMCHAAKRLLRSMGVSPAVYELDHDPEAGELEAALGGAAALPVVFVGGNLLGAIDALMASHINGSLVPLLKQAGALWL